MGNVSGEGPELPPGTAPVTRSPTSPSPPGSPPPSGPVTSEPAPGVVSAGPDAPRRRRRQRRAAAADGARAQTKQRSRLPTVAATTAVTALITTIVGGVLSQDRIDSVFGGDDEPSESAKSSSAVVEVEVDYKHVTESGRAIAVDVPESWGAVDAAFGGIGGVTSPGRGLRSGPDPMAVVFASDETVWVGASTQAFDDLGLETLDDDAVIDLFEGRLESSVYLPAHGCSPSVSHAPQLGDGWVGAVKAWQDCSAIDGWRAIEVEMVASDRDVYVYLQIGLAPSTPDEVSQRILDSLTVLPGKLPVA